MTRSRSRTSALIVICAPTLRQSNELLVRRNGSASAIQGMITFESVVGL